MKYIGTTPAETGWFTIILTPDGAYETEVFPSLLSLWHHHGDAGLVLTDVPIGLPERDLTVREPDEAVHDLLKPHQHATVIRAPSRPAVHASTLERATAINKELCDRPVSRHAWQVVPAIREMDVFLAEYPRARQRVREAHPEVCFWSFNAEEVLEESREQPQGMKTRQWILEKVDGRADEILTAAHRKHVAPDPHARTLPEGSEDVIVDALALAMTAVEGGAGLATIPEEPATDERGLPMEIVYAPDRTRSDREESDRDRTVPRR